MSHALKLRKMKQNQNQIKTNKQKEVIKHTLMILWHVESGSPTRLVPLTVMIWSPMLSLPDLAAGPVCIRLAMITVGRIEPQPDSTMTTPKISPFCFSMYTWHRHKHKIQLIIMCSVTKINRIFYYFSQNLFLG